MHRQLRLNHTPSTLDRSQMLAILEPQFGIIWLLPIGAAKVAIARFVSGAEHPKTGRLDARRFPIQHKLVDC